MSIACDATSLVELAKCFKCIPQGMQKVVQTRILAEIAGEGTDAGTILNNSRCFARCVPPGLQDALQVYLLCQILGTETCTAEALIENARCLQCIPQGMQPEVHTMLMCEWENAGTGLCSDPVVVDWLQRLADDFQPIPSDATITAVCDFCEALRISGIMDKMLVVNPVIPDSFLAMRYPLIYQVGNGNSPFINQNFVAADLNTDGLLGTQLNAQHHLCHPLNGRRPIRLTIYESDETPDLSDDEYELGGESTALTTLLSYPQSASVRLNRVVGMRHQR
jgi:hypothetical protein